MRSALILLLLHGVLLGSVVAGGSVVQLTDENFDALTASGVWLVKIYAPSCGYCRQLEPLWKVLGDEAKAAGTFRVGKVDGTKEKAILNRFKVTGYPSIYLLREGRTYTYSGARNVQAFQAFVMEGYKKEKAWPIHKAPNSLIGRVIGKVHSVPAITKRLYRVLRDEKGLSDTAIVLGFLSVPVVTGAILICLVDAVYVRRARDDMHDHED